MDLGVSRQTASNYLDTLAELKFIEKVKMGKQNYYFNIQLVDVLANAHVNKIKKS